MEHIEMFGDLSLAQDNIDDRYASHATGPTTTMSGPQLMSLLLQQSSLRSDFKHTTIVSSVMQDLADYPRQHPHNPGVVGKCHLNLLLDFSYPACDKSG